MDQRNLQPRHRLLRRQARSSPRSPASCAPAGGSGSAMSWTRVQPHRRRRRRRHRPGRVPDKCADRRRVRCLAAIGLTRIKLRHTHPMTDKLYTVTIRATKPAAIHPVVLQVR